MAVALENNDYIQRSTEMIKQLTAAEVRKKIYKGTGKRLHVLDSKNRDCSGCMMNKNTQAQLIQSEKWHRLGDNWWRHIA